MTQFLQSTYVDPFAARNLATAWQARGDTQGARAERAPAPKASAVSGSVRWWVAHYEAAGQALMPKQR